MLWKIYFWILIITAVPTYLWQGFSRAWEIIDMFVSIIALIGLFAFIWKKKVINMLFWKVFLLLCTFWNVTYQYFLPLPEKVSQMGFSGSSHFVVATITFILFTPLLIALYLYAFKRTELWKK